MKIQSKTYHSDIVISVLALFIVGGLVYTGLNALRDTESSSIQKQFAIEEK